MWLKRKLSSLVIVVGLVLVCSPSLALAVDTVVSQSFQSDQKLETGTLVARDSANNQRVIKADANNRAQLVGVVVNQDDSFVNYSDDASQVPVATAGQVVANVSTLNGDIMSGDQLTVSPIGGFAMKSTTPGKIVGRALSDFNGKTSGSQMKDVNDKQGKPVKVAIGQIQVLIQLADYSGSGLGSNPFLNNIQSIASQITGNQVSTANAVIASLIIGMAVIVSGIVLFTSVSSSIRSLGRNPLSHNVIRRSLFQVILIVVALLTASVIAAYLIIGR